MNLKQQIKEKEAELALLKEQLNSAAPTEKIKTFEDACLDQGVEAEDPKYQYKYPLTDEEVDNSGPAFERLKVIRNALLGDKKLVWGDNTPYKYFPWFNLSKPKGSGFFGSDCHSWAGSWSIVSSRLAVDSSELAIYFGSQFKSDWYEYMVEHKI